MDQRIQKAAEMLHESRRILVFTGAGLSTESGIPDFRSPGGLWERYDPSDFYFHKILSDEKAREKYWAMSSESYLLMKDALPNRGHLAIKTLEDKGKLTAIVTQNIDGLHQKAGSSPGKVIELHGTVATVSCLQCGKRYERSIIEARRASGVKIPYCDACSGILKPDTVSFGQSMPEDKMRESLRHASQCDMCIVLGTSLVVYPAAAVPVHAIENGAKLFIINRDETPMDQQAKLVIHDSIGKVMGEVMDTYENFFFLKHFL